MQAMFDAEIAAACGPMGKHDPNRAEGRHGADAGRSGYPPARLHRRGCRRQVVERAKSTSCSAISRRFVRQTETALVKVMARDLGDEDIAVLMLDGEHQAKRCVVVALAVTTDGTKKPVGLGDGSTQNNAVVRSLLVERACASTTASWSSTPPRPSRRRCEVFGSKALIQRCTLHERRNLADHRPDKEQAWMDAKRVKVFGQPDPDTGSRHAKSLAGRLDNSYPGATASLREGLEEMFTVARFGIDGSLAKTSTTCNLAESVISVAGATNRIVTRRRDGKVVLRWTAAGMLNAERSFRRIKGFKQTPISSTPSTATPTPRPPKTPTVSALPPRVHRGSSPNTHALRHAPDPRREQALGCRILQELSR